MPEPDRLPPSDGTALSPDTPPVLRPPLGRDGPTVRIEGEGGEPADGRPPAAAGGARNGAAPNYEIVTEIGRGGMSVVHLARDVKLGRFVALKRLGASFRTHPAMHERFSREARLIAALNHIHIVRLYDFDEDEQGPFIVMEYVAGPGKSLLPERPPPSLNLEKKVEQNQAPLWPREAVSLVRKLCGAIEYAHRHGVIHRDLKPSNVLLDEYGEPRIADFGLARQAQADGAKLTLTGARLLSLGYGAPEQEEDAGLADERSDIYSLGGILYFCLTGENPRFFRDSRVPEYLRPALLKALERERGLRWTSAAEFAEALSQSAADYLSPLTDVGMWRCKWCNALNPLSSRYCHQCQWDGMERCPECDGETRVGVRFCGACGTDIKAFEDMRGALNRLREYRRQKDFPRLKEAVEGTSRFQPRGARGLELLRQINELDETADWALQRRGELSQTINAALERGNYEAVRERLREMDLLDDGDTYDNLRQELPWRMAERDLIALRNDLGRAREMLAQQKLAACRAQLDAVRAGRLRLSRLEVQFPLLKGLFAGSGSAAEPGGANEFARELAAVSKEVDRIEAALAEAEQRISRLLEQARDGLRRQDYQACLAACGELRQITVDATDAEALAAEAAALQQNVDKGLAQAQQALAKGHYRAAERACRRVLERYKRDCTEARDLLLRIARKWRRRNAWMAAAAGISMAGLYVASIGPAYHATLNGLATTVSAEDLRQIYAPVHWLHDRTFLRWPLETYAHWWGLPIFGPP